MTEFRVYHGFRSPYSRLALHILRNAGLAPDIIPLASLPDDVTFADPLANKPKLAYYSEDVPRMTMRLGLPIRPPNPFEVDYMPANRALVAANNDRRGLDFAIAVSDARWGEGENIEDVAVLTEAAKTIDWDADKVVDAQSEPAIDKAIAAQKELIEKDRVFGVPFAVYSGQKFWGHDRFDLLVEIAKN